MNKVLKAIFLILLSVIISCGAAYGIGYAATGKYDVRDWFAAGTDGKDGVDGNTPFIGDNGNWFIGGTDIGVKASGTDGKDGVNGVDGKDGADGNTPYIGDSGNWFIGETDTGVKASGTDGKDGVNGVDGKDGVDGNTPYIGDNGNWFIGDIDTGVKASGIDIANTNITLGEVENIVISGTMRDMVCTQTIGDSYVHRISWGNGVLHFDIIAPISTRFTVSTLATFVNNNCNGVVFPSGFVSVDGAVYLPCSMRFPNSTVDGSLLTVLICRKLILSAGGVV